MSEHWKCPVCGFIWPDSARFRAVIRDDRHLKLANGETAPYDGYTTAYGFQWGPVEVKRACSDPRHGVWLLLQTAKEHLEIRVTRTGLFRVGKPAKMVKP